MKRKIRRKIWLLGSITQAANRACFLRGVSSSAFVLHNWVLQCLVLDEPALFEVRGDANSFSALVISTWLVSIRAVVGDTPHHAYHLQGGWPTSEIYVYGVVGVYQRLTFWSSPPVTKTLDDFLLILRQLKLTECATNSSSYHTQSQS